MEINDYFRLIKSKKQTIVSLVVIFLILGLILTAIQPFKYGSSLRLLVVQSANKANLDPYAMTRSNEYISGVLAKVTTSNSFYQRVMNSGFDIDKDYFGTTAKKQTKSWNKTISARTVSDTGIIEISAYHKNKQQAEQLARSVGHVLMTQHSNYHGMDNSVKIKLLDEPITSNYPVKPNVVLNFVLSIFLGFAFSLSYIYLLSDKKYDVKLFSRKHKEQMINEWLPSDEQIKDVTDQAKDVVDQSNSIKSFEDSNKLLHTEENITANIADTNNTVDTNNANGKNSNTENQDKISDTTSPMVDELTHKELEKFSEEWLNS